MPTSLIASRRIRNSITGSRSHLSLVVEYRRSRGGRAWSSLLGVPLFTGKIVNAFGALNAPFGRARDGHFWALIDV